MAGKYSPERREVLRLLRRAAGAAVALDLVGLSGCAGGPEGAASRLELPLSTLPVGQRVRVMSGSLPIELTRTDSGVTARLLQCTHMGCEVQWNETRQEYDCPCHGAVFDASGNVVEGPPTRPLDPYPVRVEGGSIILEG